MQTVLRAGAMLALATACALANHPALAGPSDYVASPIVEEGEREIDFKAGTAKMRDGTRFNQDSLGLGLGVNSWWFTEVYAKWHKEPGDRRSFDAWEWENKFQLTERGKYPVDVGFLLEIERPEDRSEGYEFRWGPLLQADFGTQWQGNLNLLVEKHVRTSAPAPATLGYQWQMKYRWLPQFEVGAQGFGDVGPWNHWESHADQSHVAGPALFGKVKVGQKQVIKYNAALLHGFTDAAPRTTLRLQAEYEF